MLIWERVRIAKAYQCFDMNGLIQDLTSIVGPLGHWAHMLDPDPSK